MFNFTRKKILMAILRSISVVVTFAALAVASSASWWLIYQPKTPKALKK